MSLNFSIRLQKWKISAKKTINPLHRALSELNRKTFRARMQKIGGCFLGFPQIAFVQGRGLNNECSWKSDHFWIQPLPPIIWVDQPIGSPLIQSSYMVCCPHAGISQYCHWPQIHWISFEQSTSHECSDVPLWHCNVCKYFTIVAIVYRKFVQLWKKSGQLTHSHICRNFLWKLWQLKNTMALFCSKCQLF